MPKPKMLIGKEYLPAALQAVTFSQKTIRIIIFDWRFYPDGMHTNEQNLTNEIVKAKKRGVDVKVIANNDFIKDQLNKLGIQCKRYQFTKLVHAKLVLIDEKIIIVGSHNFSNNAFEKNLEISAIFEDVECGKTLTDYFNKIW